MPVLSILRSLNVATPFTAATVRVPLSVPLLGFVPIAIVTESVDEVTVLPIASRTVTSTAELIELPAAVLLGSTLYASWEAAPAVMLNELLVASVRLPELAVKV